MRPTTAILMADTNPPTLTPTSTPPYIHYQGLTAWLNHNYARRHNYAFLYYQLTEPFGCTHVTFGTR